jgi:hypothetical protein
MKCRPKKRRNRQPLRFKTVKTASQITSQELTDDLLDFIRRKFYEGDAVGFNKDKRRLLQWVVLWPATYIEERGVTLPPVRYKKLFIGIMMLALQQGNTGQIIYRPAWLGKCVQSHFKIHWDEIYQEAKSARSLAEHTLTIAGRLPVAKKPDPIAEMALAAKLVKGTGRTRKTVLKAPLNQQQILL